MQTSLDCGLIIFWLKKSELGYSRKKKNEASLVRNNNFDGFWQLSGCAFPFFVLLATEYFCFGGSFVYDMKTSNVGISFDQHD